MQGVQQAVLDAVRGQRGSAVRSAWVLGLAMVVSAPLACLAIAGTGQSHTAVGALWIEDGSSVGGESPTARMLDSPPDQSAWIGLLRSYQVLDHVVVEQGLGEEPAVREVARVLSENLVTVVSGDGRLLRLELTGEDPATVVRVLNAIMERHVEVAAELKAGMLNETLMILEEQLGLLEAELMQSEEDLERFLSAPVIAAGLDAPSIAIEEARLRRRIATSENLYDELRARVEDARLAAASSIPDVRIPDAAALVPRRAVGLPLFAMILMSLVGLTLCCSFVFGPAISHGTFGLSESRLAGEALPVLAIVLSAALAMVGTWLFVSP